jgi:3-polyprenyl-4-hydroxybenzoate decarboxylase
MKGRIAFRNGIPLSVAIRTDPALVLIAAAPMTTHSRGVMSSGPTSKKKSR